MDVSQVNLVKVFKPQYWPPVLFYIPLYFYFLWLIAKFRGWMFLYCNPGIRYSGIIDDSKFEIYQQLKKTDSLLSTTFIENVGSPEAKLKKLKEFMSSHDLKFPVVIKPDNGFRGKGVKFIDSFERAKSYFQIADFDIMVQQFCDYQNEMGIFFYRLPYTDKIHLFSMVNRNPASVTGDGVHSVEQLANQNAHYRPILDKLKRDPTITWERVLPLGERCLISNIIKHSYGAQLEDCQDLLSESLNDWIIENTVDLRGIHLGRFDLRFKCFEDLQKGKGIKIVELNGAASESNDHQKFGIELLDKYYTIFKTWHLVFKIGQQNFLSNPQIKTSNWKFLSEAFKYIELKNRFSWVDTV